MKHMVENINEVNSVTQIPATTTRILLHHFKWDKEKLIDRFYSENQEEMFQKAQVCYNCYWTCDKNHFSLCLPVINVL